HLLARWEAQPRRARREVRLLVKRRDAPAARDPPRREVCEQLLDRPARLWAQLDAVRGPAGLDVSGHHRGLDLLDAGERLGVERRLLAALPQHLGQTRELHEADGG